MNSVRRVGNRHVEWPARFPACGEIHFATASTGGLGTGSELAITTKDNVTVVVVATDCAHLGGFFHFASKCERHVSTLNVLNGYRQHSLNFRPLPQGHGPLRFALNLCCVGGTRFRYGRTTMPGMPGALLIAPIAAKPAIIAILVRDSVDTRLSISTALYSL